MNKVLRTTTVVLVLLEIAQSYILLTANIEDVQNVAKRIVQYPIAGTVGNIMRRAYNVFNDQLDNVRSQRRRGSSHQDLDERQKDQDHRSKERRDFDNDRDFIAKENEVDGTDRQSQSNEGESGSLGKSASVYLRKIKNIFDNA